MNEREREAFTSFSQQKIITPNYRFVIFPPPPHSGSAHACLRASVVALCVSRAMETIAVWFSGLCGGRCHLSRGLSRGQAASRIQARYRGIRARDANKKQHAAAVTIQRVHRGRNSRRDLDPRSALEKRHASNSVTDEMHEMNERMVKMARGMDKHEKKNDANLAHAMRREGRTKEAESVEHNANAKKRSSRRRLWDTDT